MCSHLFPRRNMGLVMYNDQYISETCLKPIFQNIDNCLIYFGIILYSVSNDILGLIDFGLYYLEKELVKTRCATYAPNPWHHLFRI